MVLIFQLNCTVGKNTPVMILILSNLLRFILCPEVPFHWVSEPIPWVSEKNACWVMSIRPSWSVGLPISSVTLLISALWFPHLLTGVEVPSDNFGCVYMPFLL